MRLSPSEIFGIFISQPFFGGSMLMFFCIPMLFILASFGLFEQLRFLIEDFGTITGTVTEIIEDGSHDDGQTIWRTNYFYAVDGVEYEGHYRGSQHKFRINEELDVHYLVEDHAVNNVSKGGEIYLVLVGPGVLSIFILIGTAFFYNTYSRVDKITTALADGVIVKGNLIDNSATGTTVNKRRMFKVKYTYSLYNNIYHLSYSTLQPKKFTDGEEIVVSTVHPKVAFLMDALSSNIREKVKKALKNVN